MSTSTGVNRPRLASRTTPALLTVLLLLAPAPRFMTRAQEFAIPGAAILPETLDDLGGVVERRFEGLFVNAGGPGVADSEGRTWVPDDGYLTGPYATRTAAFGGWIDLSALSDRAVPHDALVTERWNDGPIHYRLPLPVGDYEVTLYFSENYLPAASPELGGVGGPDARRVFDVEVEGTRLADFCPSDAAIQPRDDGIGATYVATELAFEARVTDGALDIQLFDHGPGNPPENASIRAFSVEAAERDEEFVDGGYEEPFEPDWPSLEGARLLFDAGEFAAVLEEANGLIEMGGGLPGDCDGSGIVDVEDAMRLIDAVFFPGEDIADACEVNGDGVLDFVDVEILLAHVFEGRELPRVEDPRGEALALELLRDWLNRQWVVGPRIEMPFEDVLAEAAESLGDLVPAERLERSASLYSALLNLTIADPESMADLEGAEREGGERLADRFGGPLEMTKILDVPEGILSEFASSGFEPAARVSTIPLQVKPHKLTAVRHTINLGRIPPNFVHTWALDVAGIDRFKLGFRSVADLSMFWRPNDPRGDRIKVLDACGNVLATFRSLSDVQTKAVQLPSFAACGADSSRAHRRVYLILETGPQPRTPRRFVLPALQNQRVGSGSEEALVVADDINYETTGDFLLARDADGHVETRYPPWANNRDGSTVFDKPRAEDGWSLIGKNLTTTHARKGYHTLVYYNDIKSTLRLYLYNVNLSPDASLYDVELALRGWLVDSGGTRALADLDGAFFPIDPNPRKWSRANLTLPRWELREWIQVDVPFLYPMAGNASKLIENPPTASSTVNGRSVARYHSLYEERFKVNRRNLVLAVRVRGTEKIQLEGTFGGNAIGKAIESYEPQGHSFANDAKAVFDGIKQGVNWYEKAYKFHEKTKKELDKGGGVESLMLLSAAAGAVSGPLGVAGAAVSLISSFLSDPKPPLELSVNLALKGTFMGTGIKHGQAQETFFYLPGRCSMEDVLRSAAQGGEGAHAGDFETLDSRLPRYDRTLGLFGYQYNPGEVEIRIGRHVLGSIYTPGVAIRFPVKDDFETATNGVVPNLLPVNYNRYADITVLYGSYTVKAFSTTPNASEYRGHFTMFGQTIPGAKELTIQLRKGNDFLKPMPYASFADTLDLNADRAYSAGYFNGMLLGPGDGTNQTRVQTAPEDDPERPGYHWHKSIINDKVYPYPFPIRDIIYYADVEYEYHGPSRSAVAALLERADHLVDSPLDTIDPTPPAIEPHEHMTLSSPVRIQTYSAKGVSAREESSLMNTYDPITGEPKQSFK